MSIDDYSELFIRYGLGLVFFLFGIDQVFKPAKWLVWLPEFTPIEPNTLIFIIGIFNFVVGALLLAGVFIRIAAVLGGLHLIGVIFSIGYNDVAIRDFGLLMMAVYLAITKKHYFSLSNRFKK